jgi:hypothetical protein
VGLSVRHWPASGSDAKVGCFAAEVIPERTLGSVVASRKAVPGCELPKRKWRVESETMRRKREAMRHLPFGSLVEKRVQGA